MLRMGLRPLAVFLLVAAAQLQCASRTADADAGQMQPAAQRPNTDAGEGHGGIALNEHAEGKPNPIVLPGTEPEQRRFPPMGTEGRPDAVLPEEFADQSCPRGIVSVAANPWAMVFVDGGKSWKATPTQLSLCEGKHVLLL